jgi:hypothetical protein
LATAKLGGILFEIPPFENPHHLKKYERISVDATLLNVMNSFFKRRSRVS